MADVSLGDILKIVIHFAAPEVETMLNVFTHKLTLPLGGLSNTECMDLAESMLEDLYGKIQQDLANVITVVSAEVYDLTKDALVGVCTPTITPGSITDTLPSGVAAVAVGKPATGRARARKFLPGENDSAVVGNMFIANPTARLVQWAAQWLAGYTKITGGGISHLQSGIVHTKDGTFDDLKATRVSTIPGYQRRRKPGVGA